MSPKSGYRFWDNDMHKPKMHVAQKWIPVLGNDMHKPRSPKELDDMLRGSLTALVTPFEKSGRFDEKAFRAFVEWQLGEGTHGSGSGRHDRRVADAVA